MASIGVVGEASSRLPFCPSASTSASVGVGACASASGSGSISIGHRVHKSMLDSYFEPPNTSSSQPSFERWVGTRMKQLNVQLATFGTSAPFHSLQLGNSFLFIYFLIYSLILCLIIFYWID